MRKEFGQQERRGSEYKKGTPTQDMGGASDWSIGTKCAQGGKNEEAKIRNVPKIKGRNPEQVVKQIAANKDVEAQTINQEVMQLLSQFNIQQSTIVGFMSEVVMLNDSKAFTNNEIIDFILGQSKIRDLFARLSKS